MSITKMNFGELLTPGQMKIFFENFNEFEPQYTKVCTVEKSNKASETMPHYGSFGMWQENSEGAEIKTDTIQKSMPTTLTHRRFDKGYEISWEMLQDDQQGVWRGTAGKGGNARLLGRSLAATIEDQVAKVMSSGFTSNGYDGSPTLSTGHKFLGTSTNQSNLVTGVLSDETLKTACKMLRTQKDPGNTAPIGAIPSQLIVPADLEFTARALVHSTQVAGTDQNDANTLPNLNIIVMDYLTSDTAWFVKSRGIDNLMFFWREEPFFGSQPVSKKLDWFYYGFARFSCGFADWRGIVGSRGLAS